MMIFSSSILEVHAQSYVTYNHDEAKMNQITVQEIGAGGLTPAFYYDVFHNSYQKSAAAKNKLSFRSLAGVAAWQQIEDADSIEASLKKRAEIEALNVADRQIDIAWLAEGTKLTNKLDDFQSNINRIIGAGGTFNDKERWNNSYSSTRVQYDMAAVSQALGLSTKQMQSVGRTATANPRFVGIDANGTIHTGTTTSTSSSTVFGHWFNSAGNVCNYDGN